MKIYYNAYLLIFFLFLFSGCQDTDAVEPTVIIEPPTTVVVGSDTLTSGDYRGLTIGERAENTYTTIKNFEDSKGNGVHYLNVVSNIFTDIAKLDERLALYQSIFLDEAKGTDSGVQISFEDDKVKTIFLNSGKQLEKWPVDLPHSSAIQTGANVDEVYEKLKNISSIHTYKSKFDRMSLFTKDVFKDYDPHMAISPQWYFSTEIKKNGKMDVVHLYFKNGVLESIIINHYQTL